MTYRARVVHENRSALSFVEGKVDLGSGDFVEHIERSYALDWHVLPGSLENAHPALPTIWRVGDRTAQRFGKGLPHYDSPLLRHFIVGHIICGGGQLAAGDTYLSGQLVLTSVAADETSLEIVAEFRGLPLVIVGRRALSEGRYVLRDLAVLGPTSELYQYFFEEVRFQSEPLEQPPALPQLDWADYVSFPEGSPRPVAVRPIKDWLVFKAELPNGRPLNLVFDSGADMTIFDELVLKVDTLKDPVGQIRVAGALATGEMNLYEGFSFEVGGVRFNNLQVAGTQLTSLAIGSEVRIHGIVGSDILRLCRLDLDLEEGTLALLPQDTAVTRSGEKLELTFIGDLPHVEARVHNGDSALLLLDTGQRSALSVNLDWLDHYQLGDKLMMNGFLGDITGGLMPRYIVEELDVSLAGQTYRERTVDAAMVSTFHYEGVPVIGSIGFPLIARHFGGVTFDYYNKLIYLRKPAERRLFAGRPEAWEEPSSEAGASLTLIASSGSESASEQEITPEEYADYEYAVAAVTWGPDDPRRPRLVLDRDPSSDDPRAGYAWSESIGNHADPLALIRSTEPGLTIFASGLIGWVAAEDPRHKPVILPDRSDYNAKMRELSEVSDPVALDSANPELPVVSTELSPPSEPQVPATVGGPSSAGERAEDSMPPAVPVQLGDSADAGSAPPPDALVELAERLSGHLRTQAERVRERLLAGTEDQETAEAQDNAVYQSGLGSENKREDYPFKRGSGRLKFRPR